jgi:hypothetical protein
VQSLTPLYIPGHEKRDVKSNTNLEGRYNDGKKAEKQEYEVEQPVKRDVMADINPEGEQDEEKTVGKQAELDPGEHLVKKNEPEAASEDINEETEKERVRRDEVSTYMGRC